MLFGKKNKDITVGTGKSDNPDAYTAAKEAAMTARKQLGDKKPTISYIFFSGDYDAYKINDALKEVFSDSNFIGGSADAVFYDDKAFDKGIVIASISSEFLHVGISSNDNVSKDPNAVAQKTTREAISKIGIDKYVDPYLMFTRMKDAKVEWMLKAPSFFVQLYSRGFRMPVMGDETKIINGISEVIGSNTPIYGASFGSSMKNVFEGKPYNIFTLHNGKVLKDGIIIAVFSSSLLYGQSLEHGCKRTNKVGYISKVSNGGYVLNEISGKNAIEWYAEQLGMPKEEFSKSTLMLTQRWPLGVPDDYGNFLIRAGGAAIVNGSLAYVAPLTEGWPVYIMDGDPKNMKEAPDLMAKEIQAYTKNNKDVSIIFANLCASRHVVFQEKISDELKKIKKNFNSAPLVGFSCFGEIGSSPGKPPKFNHVCADVFVIYDKLLHELR